MKKINVFIVDDHPLFLEGIAAVLSRDERYKVVGTASNGKDALDQMDTNNTQIVICDYLMPDMNGLELMTAFRKKNHDSKFIFISQYQTHDVLNQIIQADIDGFVFKSDSTDEVFRAIDTVVRGDKFLSPKVSTVLLNKVKSNPVFDQESSKKVDITEREKEISHYITQGKTNKEIGAILSCSEHTIKCHKSNLMRKLGLKNAAEISAWAIRQNL
ncbi:MAG: response regulator transcription factor [Rhizobacter sp.]|nr:response regulator transcription factor [Bacteriovorax sp.]